MMKAILHWVSLKCIIIMQSKTSYMAPSKRRKGEAATKEGSGEFKQHLGGSNESLLMRVLVKRALIVHRELSS